MSSDLVPATASVLALVPAKAAALYRQIADAAERLEDPETIDAMADHAELEGRKVRLIYAHWWGAAHPPVITGRGNKVVHQNENTERLLGRATIAKRRAIARVPKDRLLSWLDSQLANPKTAAIKLADFEKSHPYRTEDWRNQLETHNELALDFDDDEAWSGDHYQRRFLERLVELMDANTEESKARADAEKYAKREAEQAAARVAAKNAQFDEQNIYVCSCKDMAQHVEAGSLDAIFTDPPYPDEYIECWTELANFAAHALRPGGVLLAMAGHSNLPDTLQCLLEPAELKYRWTVAMVYVKPRTRIHSAKVSVGWKPLLAFTRDGGHPSHYSHDAFKFAPYQPSDKDAHEWGQSEADMQSIASEWLRPGWKVCDPFVGAGSLLAAAKIIGCEVVGCDIDAGHVETTRGKLR